MKSIPYHRCFETLSSPLRIEIIRLLESGEKSVNEIEDALHAEQSRVSHALQDLKQCKFVDVSVRGKERVYKLSGSFLEKMPKAKNMFEVIAQHYEKYCKECVKIQR